MKLDSDTEEAYNVYLEILKSGSFPNMANPDISDLLEADRLATTQFPEDEKLIWQDARANQQSKIKPVKVSDKEVPDVEFAIARLCEETDGVFHKQARESGKYDRREIGNMYEYALEDLQLIMVVRAVQGRTNIFYEKLFDAYKQGGWPCYWEGSIPEGRPLTYANSKSFSYDVDQKR